MLMNKHQDTITKVRLGEDNAVSSEVGHSQKTVCHVAVLCAHFFLR